MQVHAHQKDGNTHKKRTSFVRSDHTYLNIELHTGQRELPRSWKLASIFPIPRSYTIAPRQAVIYRADLPVRLLETSASTATAELLGLGPAGIGNKKGTVILEEGILDLLLGGLVDVLLVEGNDGLGDRLADSVDLRDATTTTDADADVEVTETLHAKEVEGLINLPPESLGLDELEGGTWNRERNPGVQG